MKHRCKYSVIPHSTIEQADTDRRRSCNGIILDWMHDCWSVAKRSNRA